MAKYTIYRDAEGVESARTERYTPKAGEKKVGTVDGESGEEALKAFEKDGSSPESGNREPTEEDKTRELDELREAEESKEEFTVMADADGNMYVEGDESSDPAKQKKAAPAKAPKDEKPSEVGSFRAKDAAEALKMAKGTYADPAAGHPRGAQTP